MTGRVDVEALAQGLLSATTQTERYSAAEQVLRLGAERDALRAERDRLQEEFLWMQTERDEAQGEANRLARERNALRAERNEWRRLAEIGGGDAGIVAAMREANDRAEQAERARDELAAALELIVNEYDHTYDAESDGEHWVASAYVTTVAMERGREALARHRAGSGEESNG